jgi:hypothetical protein
VGYALAFVVAARWPGLRHWTMAGSNLVLTINAVWIWRPESFTMTDAERAEFGRPARRRRSAP